MSNNNNNNARDQRNDDEMMDLFQQMMMQEVAAGGGGFLGPRPRSVEAIVDSDPTLGQLKCPICNAVNDYSPSDDNTADRDIKDHLSHGGRLIYTSNGNCPVCMEDSLDVVVSLKCGHCVCRQDFTNLGGKTGQLAHMSIPEARAYDRRLAVDLLRRERQARGEADDDDGADGPEMDGQAMAAFLSMLEGGGGGRAADFADMMRRVRPDAFADAHADSDSYDDYDSDDDSDDDFADLPALMRNPGRGANNNNNNSSDDDSFSSEPPELLQRDGGSDSSSTRTDGGGDDSDSSGLPALITRHQLVDSSDSSANNSSDDDEPRNPRDRMVHRGDSDSSESMPDLMQRVHGNANDDSSSSSSSDSSSMPGLVAPGPEMEDSSSSSDSDDSDASILGERHRRQAPRYSAHNNNNNNNRRGASSSDDSNTDEENRRPSPAARRRNRRRRNNNNNRNNNNSTTNANTTLPPVISVPTPPPEEPMPGLMPAVRPPTNGAWILTNAAAANASNSSNNNNNNNDGQLELQYGAAINNNSITDRGIRVSRGLFAAGSRIADAGGGGRVWVYGPPTNNNDCSEEDAAIIEASSDGSSHNSNSATSNDLHVHLVFSLDLNVKMYVCKEGSTIVGDGGNGIWCLSPALTNSSYVLIHQTPLNRSGRVVRRGVPAGTKMYLDSGGSDQSKGVWLFQPCRAADTDSPADSLASILHCKYKRKGDDDFVEGGGDPIRMNGPVRVHADTLVTGDADRTGLFVLEPGSRSNPDSSILKHIHVQYDETVSTEVPVKFDMVQSIVNDGSDAGVYIHCRLPQDASFSGGGGGGAARWKLHRTNVASYSASVAVLTEFCDCPKTSRLLSDGLGGVWMWKKVGKSTNRALVLVGNGINGNTTQASSDTCETPGRYPATSIFGFE